MRPEADSPSPVRATAPRIGRASSQAGHLELDPRARYFLWIDPHRPAVVRGRPCPTLLLILARASTPSGEPTEADRAHLAGLISRAQLTTQYHWPSGPSPDDVHWIAADATSFRAPLVEDGPAPDLVLIALGPGLEERSRLKLSGQPAHPAPRCFSDRLEVELKAEELPPGSWLDTPGLLGKVQATLRLRDRWLVEPSAEGRATLLDTQVEVRVDPEDLYFGGSQLEAKPVALPKGAATIAELLASPLSSERWFPGQGPAVELRSVAEVYVAHRPAPLFAGRPLEYFSDRSLPLGPRVELLRHSIDGGAVLELRLHEVLSAAPGQSLLGYSLDVGFREGEHFEPWCDRPIKCGQHSSGEQILAGVVRSGQRGSLELIVRNRDGLPVARARL